MKKMKTMTILVATFLLASIMATTAIGNQLALGDNNHNKLKIDQDANQKNKCKLSNELENSDKNNNNQDSNFACANIAFNIVCLPNSVCIVPNENTPYKLVTPT